MPASRIEGVQREQSNEARTIKRAAHEQWDVGDGLAGDLFVDGADFCG